MAVALSLSMLLPCVNVAHAEDYMSNFSASILNADGNILFDIDKNATLTLDATKVTSVNEVMYAKVSIKTAKGDVVANELVDLTASKKASYTIKEVPEYGIYALEVDLYGKDSNKYYGKLASSFSVVNGPKDGTVNPVHGVCVHYRDGQDLQAFGDTMITTDLAAKAGFSTARSEITWNKYATYDASGNGTYKIADRQAQIMENVTDNGMGILEILSYDHSKYPMSTTGKYNNNMTAPFVTYAENLIEDVLEINPDAEFEIWNEWNNEGSWFNEDSLSPQSYAKLAKAVYEKLGSKATLWGMATLGADTDWIEEVLEEWDYDGYFWQNKNEDQKLYMDGISVHPYANWSQPEGSQYINVPEWTEENPVYEGPVEKTQELKEMLESRNIGSTPLRATEWGWISTGAKAYQNNSSTDSTQIFVGYYPDRDMQAAYFVRMAALSEGYDLYDKMDYYQINSKNGADDSDFGLLMSSTSNVPYGAKPSYLVAANYNRIMTGATPKANAVTNLNDVYMTAFDLADGRDCAIVWSAALDKNRVRPENITKNVTLDLGDDEIIVCDMLGNEITATSETGEYNFKVDGQPTYIIGNFTETALATASAGSMIDECYYNALKDEIVVNAKATNATAVLKQAGVEKQTLELVSAADRIEDSVRVDAGLAAGDYTLEITADGNVYTKDIEIPARQAGVATASEFEPGMVALYTAATRTVNVIGKLSGRNANEPIIVMVAKAPAENAEITESDIAYVEVFNGSEEDFELTFTLPEGNYGKYVVRAGAMNAQNASENGLANPEHAVVCTFTASATEDTVSATATFANYSEEDTRPATIIFAQYDKNKSLIDMSVEEYTVTKSEGVTEPKTLTQTIYEDATLCKVFVWNSVGELIPLVSPIEINVD